MITPTNPLPPDDSETEDEEQLSQQDIHSNGFDGVESADDEDETDALNQAYDASEPAYTLDADEDED